MKKSVLLLVCFQFSCCLLHAGEKPERNWTNLEGKVMSGSYLRCDGVTVWIRPTSQREASLVPLVSLSPADRAAVKEFRDDFSWKLPLVSWPAMISAPATRPASKVSGQPKDALPVYRTRIFEFTSDKELSPQEVGKIGKTFEATNELFSRLPWDVRPAPPDGPFYKVRIYAEQTDFLAAVEIKEPRGPETRIAGIYRSKDRTVHVPLDSLREDRSATNETLRHELAHQMMHDLLPVLPWWLAEGTAEYIRIIPWSSSAYACGSVAQPPVMKAIAAEGVMNRIAFEEMIAGPGSETQEAALAGSLKEGRQRMVGWLLEVRKKRAALLAGKPVPAGTNEAAKPVAEPGGIRRQSALVPGPDRLDENLVIVSKYHAAKMLVYYLQHLEGDGKGSRMYALIWHLRQWADELAVQRIGFNKKADEFREAVSTFEARARDFDKQETEYQSALLNWKHASAGQPGALPAPLAPEEELLKLVPEVPDATPFSPQAIRVRWSEIEKKALGGNPALLFNDVIEGFRKKNIKLPVLEGDPRAKEWRPILPPRKILK